MRAVAPITQKTPGRELDRAGGSRGHKLVECNVININFQTDAQAR
jgi:hypothetical protein